MKNDCVPIFDPETIDKTNQEDSATPRIPKPRRVFARKLYAALQVSEFAQISSDKDDEIRSVVVVSDGLEAHD